MTASIRKRSLTIAGHRTSISLEDIFWETLSEIARTRGLSVTSLVEEIDKSRGANGLSSSIRIYLLNHFRAQSK